MSNAFIAESEVKLAEEQLAEAVWTELGAQNTVSINELNSDTQWKRKLKFLIKDAKIKGKIKLKFFEHYPELFYCNKKKDEISALLREG